MCHMLLVVSLFLRYPGGGLATSFVSASDLHRSRPNVERASKKELVEATKYVLVILNGLD